MKHLLKTIFIVLLSIALIATMHSCKKVTAPTVTTVGISCITQTNAKSGGNVIDDGGAEVNSRGICWSTTQNPTIGTNKTMDGASTGTFISTLTGLTPNTKYYVRAYAFNGEGIGYGNEVSFTTSPIVLATIATAGVNSISSSGAVCGGNITFDGGGSIIERGICWATHQNPTTNNDRTLDGTGIGSFTSNMRCLSFATTYYVCAYATNSAGTAYGDQQSFITQGNNPIIFNPNLTYGSVTDIDGNCYKIIQIGDQIWMAENLKTTKLNDGTIIPLITDNNEWINLSTPGYCWYDNNETNYKAPYGALYNWYVVGTGKLCPVGWHVPTRDEWHILWYPYNIIEDPNSHDNPYGTVGNELMETGTTHWIKSLGTNETGFAALPGGTINFKGTFYDIGVVGFYWSSTNVSEIYRGNVLFLPIPVYQGYGGTPLQSMRLMKEGLSIRCLKD
jgi:uncharacterized protein (TIGR02145 family)